MEKGCDERSRFFEHLGLNFIKTSSLIWLEILEQFLDPCRCNADVCVDSQGLQVALGRSELLAALEKVEQLKGVV